MPTRRASLPFHPSTPSPPAYQATIKALQRIKPHTKYQATASILDSTVFTFVSDDHVTHRRHLCNGQVTIG
jgi:hypothetical protein